MKLIVNLARVIVGILFIFSGLVKANDPLGLSYKMHEFFEVWKVTGFNSWTLPFSIVMNAFEIIAGVALLLGWRIRLFSWLLFLLILFFTFLTGYTYVTGKPTNCGCFGDCLPISSKVSFLKDVVLTVLIALILWQRHLIKPLLGSMASNLVMLLATIFSFGLQWYSLTYLPPVDCLPFKKGNNISQKMQAPAGSVSDSFAIRFVYKKDGKEFEFAPAELPADLNNYEYIRRTDKLIRKGNAEPPIKGFSLSRNGESPDTSLTNGLLREPYAILIFVEDFSVPFSKWSDEFNQLVKAARQKNISAQIITGRPSEAAQVFSAKGAETVPIYSCDVTAIRTAARTNPCFFLLKEGTVVDKKSYHHVDELIRQIEKLPSMPTVQPGQTTIDTLNQH